MAGPWERYARPENTPQGEPGAPWTRYAAPAEAPAQEPARGEGRGFLPFLYRGASSVLGAPVDLANAALRATGLPVSERPVGGSASIEALLARYGEAIGRPMIPAQGAEAETLPEYVGRGVGEAAGMLVPGYGVANLLARSASPTVAGVAGAIARAPAVAPISTLTGEIAAGAGAGAGRYAAEKAFPESETAGLYGELAGGFAPSLATLAAKYGPTGMAYRAARKALTPSSQAGAEIRAGERLASLVADPESAARAAETPSISELTPAQRTQDPRLLSLERAIAERDPAIAEDLAERAVRAQTTLLEEARALGGDPTQTREFLEGRRAQIEEAVNRRVETAQVRANERIAALEPGSSAEDASRIVREEFDRVYNLARQQENDLWRSIPQDVQVDTAPLFNRFDEIVANTPRTQQQDIPEYARRFLSPDAEGNRGLQNIESPAELQGFRSELLAIERRASDAGERNQARLARQLADATLDAMNALPDVGGAYGVARDYSRQLNLTFREGPAGRLAETTFGSPTIDPELTLSRLIGAGGVRGGIGERSLMAATGESPEAQAAIQDYLMRSLRDRVVTSEGRLRPEPAASWMRQNEALLERYPEIRDRLTAAISAQQRADDLAQRQAATARELRSPTESPLARYLGGNPVDAVSRVFKADNPVEAVTTLRRSVARDPSGQALSGLRGAFVEDLLSRSRSVTPDGEVFSGSTIRDTLSNPQQRAALEVIFNADDMQRLRQIGDEFTALERARGRLPSVGAPMADAPNKMVEVITRAAAARASGLVSSSGAAGSLQAAQMASSNANKFLQTLTNDRASRLLSQAITDPELFSALMRQTRTPQQEEQAVRRLQGWLVSPAGRAFFIEEGESSNGSPDDIRNIYNSVINPYGNMNLANHFIDLSQNRVSRVFQNQPQSDLFMAALRREAQLFHNANQVQSRSRPNVDGWDRSLTNLVTSAITSGNVSDDVANRASEMLMSNDPRQVAAAIRLLENASSRRR